MNLHPNNARSRRRSRDVYVVLWVALVLPLAACSTPVPSPPSEAISSGGTGTQSRSGAVCSALQGNDQYLPVPAMGLDFPGSALEIFRVEGVPGVQYASRPTELDDAPEGAAIQLAYALEGDEGFELTVCFQAKEAATVHAHSGPIRASGGEHPVVSRAFVANSDADPAPELVLLVSWAVSNVLGTSGRLYEPFSFDFPRIPGLVPSLPLDDQVPGPGFDGTLEGEAVEYPYKTEDVQ